MSQLGIVIIGIIILISIGWQLKIIEKISYSDGARGTVLGIPLAIGAVITFGVLVYSVFLFMDDTKSIEFSYVVKHTIRALAFTIIIMFKSYLGPIFNGWLASYSVYNYFEHNIFEVWPFMNWIISLIIEAPGDTATLEKEIRARESVLEQQRNKKRYK